MRADVAKVTPGHFAQQLGGLYRPSAEPGLVTRPYKNAPIPHHRRQQSSLDSRDWWLAVGLCTDRRGTSDHWLYEHQAAAYDAVPSSLLRKSIRGRVRAVLFLSPFTHALYSEPGKHRAVARMSDINCSPRDNREYRRESRSRFCDLGRQCGDRVRYFPENDLASLDDPAHLRWADIQTNQWQGKLHSKQAEFLVADRFDWSAIVYVGCHNGTTVAQVTKLMPQQGGAKVGVQPGWYYS